MHCSCCAHELQPKRPRTEPEGPHTPVTDPVHCDQDPAQANDFFFLAWFSIFPALIWERLPPFMEGNAYTLVALIGAGLCEVQHSNWPNLPISIPWVLPDRAGQYGNGEVSSHSPGFFPQELWEEAWPRWFSAVFPCTWIKVAENTGNETREEPSPQPSPSFPT